MGSDENNVDTKPNTPTVPAARVSRRALLRGASAAVPAILTLKSGAAMAHSSNMIGIVANQNQAIGPQNTIQCLDSSSAVGGTTNQLDLGNTPMLHVQYIAQRQYYRPNRFNNAGDLTKPVSISQMCSQGGVFWYKDYGVWKSTVPGYNRRGVDAGFLVSATALSSFAQNIKAKTWF